MFYGFEEYSQTVDIINLVGGGTKGKISIAEIKSPHFVRNVAPLNSFFMCYCVAHATEVRFTHFTLTSLFVHSILLMKLASWNRCNDSDTFILQN